MDENDVLTFDDGPAEEADVREVPEDNTEHEMRGGERRSGGGGHVRGGGRRGRRGGGGEHGMEFGHVRGGGHRRGHVACITGRTNRAVIF